MNYKSMALAAFMSKSVKEDSSFKMALSVLDNLSVDQIDERYNVFINENVYELRHGLKADFNSPVNGVQMAGSVKAVCCVAENAEFLVNLYEDCVNVEKPILISHAESVGQKVEPVGQLQQDTWVTAFDTGEFCIVTADVDMHDVVCSLGNSFSGYTKVELYKACNLNF